MGPVVCSLLAVSVIGSITLLVPVRSQCTTKYCVDDDSDRSVLTTMVARLQDTVERQQQTLEQQHQDHQHLVTQLHQDNQHSVDQLQKQYRELQQVLNTSTEHQLQIQRRETQLKELTKLRETLAKYENLTVDGAWSSWTTWSTCSAVCAGGRHHRTRKCDNPAPDCGGADCTGPSVESGACNIKRCPDDALNCADLLNRGFRTSGVYDIYLPSMDKTFKVYCDQDSDEGGWMVFQRRQDGSVDFYRDWENYKEGFGNLTGEFWLGNDYLHWITSQANYKLRVELTNFTGSTGYAVYTTFAVASESNRYRLSIGGYRGTVGDSMTNGIDFSTKDRDNDNYYAYSPISGPECAINKNGAWWYDSCGGANLNGKYYHYCKDIWASWISWSSWLGSTFSLQRTEMKIRP